jgi:hypothetical protein
MILSAFSKSALSKSLGRAVGVMVLVTSVFALGRADLPSPDLAQMFPADLGGFHEIEAARQILPGGKEVFRPDPKTPLPVLVAEAEYAAPNGEKIRIGVARW